MSLIEHLVRILSARAMPRAPEVALQDAIEATLTDHRIAFDREVRLSAWNIVDFLVEGNVALEVKIDGSLSEVTRQLHRYAQSDRVAELLLVTTRSRHMPMPPGFAAKPLRVLRLIGGAF